MAELLQQARVIDPVSETDQLADVLIENGEIIKVAATITEIPSDTQIRNCQGLILGTGLIDLYSHSGEPGFEERETLNSLLQAAAHGGFTRINILPDTHPIIDNPAPVTQLQKISQNISTISNLFPIPHLNIWGAISQNISAQQLNEFADFATEVIGFTDAKPLDNLAMVRRVLEYLQPFNKTVAFWACNTQLRGNGIAREGADALRLGLPFIPESAETSAIAALLELVAFSNTPVHIMRVSTARSVELIASAKSRGLPITASTTWMHLLLDTKALKSYNPSLRLDPPLGNKSDMKALRKGVQEGIIDAIAIDHTAYTYEEKTVAFADAPPGAIGYELALSLLWQNLVETGEFTPLELWRLLSNRPAECLQQKVSKIAPNHKSELTLFDPQQTWTVKQTNLHTLSANTPWYGQQLKGKVIQTWC
ncbi:dihydroorotase [Calothrix sp. NIES-4071]|nr:dihydroorotase [Calothrix sp. NIES-4071]BAZ63827.1 dihydroorotase [Calothrix sp. NIES-4105]